MAIDPDIPGTEPDSEGEGDAEATEQVHNIGKLLRVGGMLREMLDETRRESLDTDGRRRAQDLLARALTELKDAISPDLQAELDRVNMAFTGEVPTQSELRISQSELVGWFEGLFHGMQATLMGQQLAAGQGGPVPHPMRRPGPQRPEPGQGQYL